MSEVPILKETTRTTGREALRNNITAAMALAGAVRTTLGPLGQDKLLIDDEGRTMVTNDGVTVLESAKVEHPVAKMLINASTTQDRIARDGTTSAVLLSAELLQNAWELVLQGVHPSAIARGYRHAEEACRQHFETSRPKFHGNHSAIHSHYLRRSQESRHHTRRIARIGQITVTRTLTLRRKWNHESTKYDSPSQSSKCERVRSMC